MPNAEEWVRRMQKLAQEDPAALAKITAGFIAAGPPSLLIGVDWATGISYSRRTTIPRSPSREELDEEIRMYRRKEHDAAQAAAKMRQRKPPVLEGEVVRASEPRPVPVEHRGIIRRSS